MIMVKIVYYGHLHIKENIIALPQPYLNLNPTPTPTQP